jgi:hypothetical protein
MVWRQVMVVGPIPPKATLASDTSQCPSLPIWSIELVEELESLELEESTGFSTTRMPPVTMLMSSSRRRACESAHNPQFLLLTIEEEKTPQSIDFKFQSIFSHLLVWLHEFEA